MLPQILWKVLKAQVIKKVNGSDLFQTMERKGLTIWLPEVILILNSDAERNYVIGKRLYYFSVFGLFSYSSAVGYILFAER